jgi:predicted phosphoribosyltransferase
MPAVGGTMAAMQFPFSDREAAGRLLGEAVVQALRQQRLENQPTVVLALTRGGVPVGAVADGDVCLRTPENFAAVGWHYVRFPQVQDDEVCAAFKTVAEALP